MAKSATAAKARAPQGAKRVAQAFLDELGTISQDKQADVAKAAQAMVKDNLAARKEKAKAEKAKSRLVAQKAKPAPRAKAAPKPTRAAAKSTRGRKPGRRAATSKAEQPSDEASE